MVAEMEVTCVSFSLCHFLTVLSNQHDVINAMDQCDVLWDVQVIHSSSQYIMIEGKKVNVAMTHYKCKLLIPNE